MLVDGAAVDGRYWMCRTGEWCFSVQIRTSVLLMSGAQIRLPDVQVRTVEDWTAYGIDLRRPQAAAAIGSRAAQTRTEWDDLGDST